MGRKLTTAADSDESFTFLPVQSLFVICANRTIKFTKFVTILQNVLKKANLTITNTAKIQVSKHNLKYYLFSYTCIPFESKLKTSR